MDMELTLERYRQINIAIDAIRSKLRQSQTAKDKQKLESQLSRLLFDQERIEEIVIPKNKSFKIGPFAQRMLDAAFSNALLYLVLRAQEGKSDIQKVKNVGIKEDCLPRDLTTLYKDYFWIIADPEDYEKDMCPEEQYIRFIDICEDPVRIRRAIEIAEGLDAEEIAEKYKQYHSQLARKEAQKEEEEEEIELDIYPILED